MDRKFLQTIGIEEAMDNVTAIAAIDLKSPGPIGIVKRHRIVVDEAALAGAEWLSGEGVEPLLDVLDLTYRSIHQYLVKIVESGDEKERKGAAAIMAVVGESAAKLEAFFAIRLGHPIEEKIWERESFKVLQRFYQEKILKEPESLPSDEGLRDFETVKRDVAYELFYIRREDGKPYFDAELLKQLRLSCNFDMEGELEEDPLLKIRAMQDRDLHASAGQIIKESYAQCADYFHIARKLEGNELAQSLSMAMMALFLAANPRYLIQNTTGKSCVEYFDDFQRFLRRAMRTSEYQKWIAYPDSIDKTSDLLLHLTHLLARKFFERAGGVKLESIGLIHRAMRRGEELKQKEKEHLYKGETLWNQFLIDDEKFRTLLSHFPNGPLFKILDLIREETDEDTIIPFDPIGQHNLPGRMFHIDVKGQEIEVLRLPSPTRQSLIHKVDIVDEFKGFLRGLGKGQKLLLINLQDRTSSREYARCKAIEGLQMNAEFSQHILVLTLPKDTDFYHQNNEYTNLNSAAAFMKAFQEQLATPDSCGFFFPPQLKLTEVAAFADVAIPLIHEHFFQGKTSLTRRHREDFIEIFYQLFILKCIDLFAPYGIAISCKDGVDTTAAELAALYGCIANLEKKENQDMFRWLLYTPALFVRERAINPERFSRVLSLLESASGKEMAKVFQELFSFKTISVRN